MTGLISDIQHFSVNDGYGIRTIVFLSGCTMKCAWCQNPETISGAPSLMFNPSLCEGCGVCIKECPTAACCVNNLITVNRDACINCFRCVDSCFYNARQASCKSMTAEEVFAVVLKDEVFFKNTGGGLTLSGGEPLNQSGFSAELLRMAKDKNISAAIETAGNVLYSSFMSVLPYTDLFLYDIKLFDEEKHIKWTGVSNRQILQNLERLCKTKNEIIIRIPLIPGINDGMEFRSIVDYISTLKNINEIHILPYHTIGSDKYVHLGMEYSLEDVSADNNIETDNCKKYAESKGFRVSVGGAGF